MEGYQQQDILNEVSTVLEQASTGKRLANYLIDLVIFYLAYFLVIFIIYAASPDTLDTDGGPNEFFDRLLALASYGIFLGFIEGIFKGKTLGKAITGTK